MQEDAVVKIADKVGGKSPAQVLIRYCLQKGWVPLTKSENEARVKENIDVFDFVLSKEDMASLDRLDRGEAPKFE